MKGELSHLAPMCEARWDTSNIDETCIINNSTSMQKICLEPNKALGDDQKEIIK